MYLQTFGWVSISLAKYGWYEKTVTDYIFKNLKPDSTVLDIGANIGYYSLIMAKLVGKNGCVYAFEPEPSNFDILTKNITINNYPNIHSENYAVSDHDGKTKLFLSKVSAGSHKITYSPNVSKNNIEVNVISLNSFFKKNSIDPKSVDFIKMDVEGAEFNVLKGMKNILSKTNNLQIILEFDPPQLREFNVEPKNVLKFLQDFDFSFSVINNKSNKITKLSGNLDLIDADNLSGNYLLCKK